ncbi:hypothetical protein DH2020_008034 [Rehmannia glutinosa]|uniref:Pentatricopeptide repeat-containing protein n=1 Tax=Rehmannia glutinosa TaxID=99300 RepID=A0ABR0U0V5_REHGL
MALEPQIGLEILCDFTNKKLERQFADQQFCALLLNSLPKTLVVSFYACGVNESFVRGNANDSYGVESETEWERLLKPFDLEELRKSFNRITPFQLNKLLQLPLDVHTSMQLFQWAGSQMGYRHSFDVYYTLIDKAGAVKEFKIIDRLLLQMKEEGIVLKESIFIMIMRHYGRAGLPGQATRLLFDMRSTFSCEPTFKSYNVVLDVLLAGNCPKVAPNVIYEMLSKGISPTVFTFARVMKALCMVNEVDSACSLLRDMTKHGCVPNSIVYQTLIHALFVASRVNDALKLLEEMFLMGCTPDVNTFNDVIIGLCRVDRVHEAAKLVDRMLVRGFAPDDITYGVLMQGLCKTGQVDEARVLLKRVPNPNVALFNTLINGDGQVQEALELFRNMSSKGCKADIFTFNSLIYGLTKINKMDKALCMYQDMFLDGVIANTVTYNTLIHAFLRERETHKALKLVNDMLFRGCPLDEFTYTGLIKALCEDGAVEKSLGLFEEMLRKGLSANNLSCNILIGNLCRAGKIQNALEFLREMIYRGLKPDIVTYNNLISGLCKMRRIQEAYSLFEKLKTEGVCPDAITYNILIGSYCKAGSFEEKRMRFWIEEWPVEVALLVRWLLNFAKSSSNVELFVTKCSELCVQGMLQTDSHFQWQKHVSIYALTWRRGKVGYVGRSPSQVGLGTQDHLQVKELWPLQSGVNEPDDSLPPGFEGIQPANIWRVKLSQIPLIKWRCPPKHEVNIEWQVVAGEESKEVEAQNHREMRVLEAIYPRPSAISPNPSPLVDMENSFANEENTPLIPATSIEDDDAALDTSLGSLTANPIQ